jgi:hypothetical protein
MIERMNFFAVVLIALLFVGCGDNRFQPDLSDVQVDVDFHRTEKVMFEGAEFDYQTHLDLHEKLGSFYKNYVEIILRAGYVDDSLTVNSIKLWMKDRDIKEIYSDVSKKYANTDDIKADLQNAFTYYSYYFPEKSVPKVATYISGFNYAIAASDSVLGIGLDMYLGSDYKFYSMIGFPQYKIQRMSKEFLVSDAVKSWIATEFDFDPIGKDLLSQIVHHGKVIYALDAVMPQTPLSIKLNYTEEQLNWCKSNEVNIWSHLLDNNLLFSTNSKEIMKFINEGPFTPGFPKESPSQVGIWIGYQIVREFMNRKGNVDLLDLMETEADVILKQSKYKPKF